MNKCNFHLNQSCIVSSEDAGISTPGISTPGISTPGMSTPGISTPGIIIIFLHIIENTVYLFCLFGVFVFLM